MNDFTKTELLEALEHDVQALMETMTTISEALDTEADIKAIIAKSTAATIDRLFKAMYPHWREDAEGDDF